MSLNRIYLPRTYLLPKKRTIGSQNTRELSLRTTSKKCTLLLFYTLWKAASIKAPKQSITASNAKVYTCKLCFETTVPQWLQV